MGEMINRIKISENFFLDEFQCRCCHSVKIEPELLEELQNMRTKAKFPFVLNSAYRCIEHNRREGGVNNSFHTQGKAVDVSMGGHSRESMVNLVARAQEIGFTGIGCYYSKTDGSPLFLHLDVGTDKLRHWERIK